MGNAFKLNNGLLLLSTEAPGGVYNSTQLKKVAALADGETAIVKATEDQRLALFVKESAVAKVTQELQAVGLGVRHYQDGLHQPVNCLGELCAEHVQDAMGASMDIAQELKKTQLGSALKIGINGCGRCCVATHTLDVSIIGDSNGYRISLGGKNSQIPEMASFMAEGVPAAKLPKLVAKVIAVYKELAQKDESLQEVMERAGSKKFIEALAPYSQDAAQDDPFAGMSDSSPASASPQEDVKIEDMSSNDEFGDTIADVGPAVDDDMGEIGLGEVDAGPNFDDVGPATSEDPVVSGLEEDDGLLLEGGADSDLLADDVPIASLDDDSLGDVTSEAIGDLSVESDDELVLETSVSAGDDLSFEETSPADAVSTGESASEELDMSESSEDLALGEIQGIEELELADVGAELVPELDDASLEQAASSGDLDFDASEVAAAPAVEDAILQEATLVDEADGEFANEMVADEVAESEADAFEAKLNESIAEEEGMPEIEDLNAGDRMEAMRLVEASAELPSVDAVQETLNTDGSFENLEIDHEFEPEVLADDGAEAEVSASAAAQSSGFDLAGIDVTTDGRVALSFSSGANVSIDPRALGSNGRKDFVMGGKKISLKSGAKGLSVEVDGVAIFLPRRAA